MRTNPYIKDVEPSDTFSDSPYIPVFIMGDHRSGTTLLYKLLSSSQKFDYLTAYDVICYEELLKNFELRIEKQEKEKLDISLEKNGVKDRGIDNVIVNSSLPEEYGFILEKKSDSKMITEENLSVFIEICKTIQTIKNSPNTYLLLKNPDDFCNIDFIDKNIPNSKFIVLYRNVEDIAKSRRKAYAHLLKYYSYYTSLLSNTYDNYFQNWFLRSAFRLYFSKFNFVARIRNLKYTKMTRDNFMKKLKEIDSSKYIVTSYEDICKDSNYEINRIFRFLGIECDDKIDFNYMIRKR